MVRKKDAQKNLYLRDTRALHNNFLRILKIIFKIIYLFELKKKESHQTKGIETPYHTDGEQLIKRDALRIYL